MEVRICILKRRKWKILDGTVEFAPLQVVFVFFDTATYDEIERDVKVTFTKKPYKIMIN